MGSAYPVWPVPGGRVLSHFGPRRGGFHAGVDIFAERGTPTLAVLPGVVRLVAPTGTMNDYGNAMVIEHVPGALYSLYSHLDSFRSDLVRGNPVVAGELIGSVGDTAGTRADPGRRFQDDAPHVHFELLERWPPAGVKLSRINPAGLLQLAARLQLPAGPQRQQLAARVRPRNETPAAQGDGGMALLLVLAALAAGLG